MPPTVLSVNVGRSREVDYRGQRILTSIWKEPVAGRVNVSGVNIDGDVQSDLRVHGGPDKAVYAYSIEDLGWWAARLTRELSPGTFGENLTTSGLDLGAAVIGERWQVGDVELEVAQPRSPCFKLGIRMGNQAFVREFRDEERPGAYLRIIRAGSIAAGDGITVTHRPTHGVTIREVNHAYTIDPAGAARLLDAPELPRSVLDWARQASAG